MALAVIGAVGTAASAAEAGIGFVSKAMELRQQQVDAAEAEKRRATILHNLGTGLAVCGAAAVVLGGFWYCCCSDLETASNTAREGEIGAEQPVAATKTARTSTKTSSTESRTGDSGGSGNRGGTSIRAPPPAPEAAAASTGISSTAAGVCVEKHARFQCILPCPCAHGLGCPKLKRYIFTGVAPTSETGGRTYRQQRRALWLAAQEEQVIPHASPWPTPWPSTSLPNSVRVSTTLARPHLRLPQRQIFSVTSTCGSHHAQYACTAASWHGTRTPGTGMNSGSSLTARAH